MHHINFSMKKLTLILLSAMTIALASQAEAAPILLTISETDNQQTTAWWPSRFGSDKSLTDAFSSCGLDVMDTAGVQPKPRLSPVVYGQKPLSSANARTLGSLFGTNQILNGNITWNCQADSQDTTRTTCNAKAEVTLLYDKNREYPISLNIRTSGPDKQAAQNFALAQIASQIALPVLSKSSVSEGIPAITEKPVLILASLPDADTLVTLRKRLKRIPEVKDVTERWVANGQLALDINPDQPALSQTDFSVIIQKFATEFDEGVSVHETSRSSHGVVFEITKP